MRISLGIAGVLAVAAAGITAVAEAGQSGGPQSGGPQPTALQSEFASAAAEFHVPESVLLAVAYQESRWDTHNGQPSTTGNYNVMGLTQVTSTQVRKPSLSERMAELDLRGDGKHRAFHPSQRVLNDVGAVDTTAPGLHTLDAAAQLTGASAGDLRGDMKQSVRGGAALLAQYEKQATGGLPTDPAQWYGAVERYSQSPDSQGAVLFAQRVFTHIREGISRTTADGQQVTLAAHPDLRPRTTTASTAAGSSSGTGTMDYATTAIAPAATATTPTPECPSGLACNFVPAAYALPNGVTDPTQYGNYDIANRPADGDAIKYIVIHDTESNYNSAVSQFQDPTAQSSAHYVISATGQVTQMVPNADIAWHAGNKYINMHAIGIEHEGYAIPTSTWYTESEYDSSAQLVQYLAAKYNIPLDREHIFGHDNVPGPLDAYVAGMHWDPGPFWDWNHYMQLLGAPSSSAAVGSPLQAGEVVQITPPFTSANEPPVATASTQPANFVYLRTGPSSTAALLADPYLHSSGAGTTAGPDWGDKATAGQQFVVAAQQGDWTAIWYGGREAWFFNPGGQWTVPVSTGTPTLITPASGASTISVYGRAYPEASAYPSTIKAEPVSSLSKYTIPAGQVYLAQSSVTGDLYNAVNINGDAPGDRTLVTGTTTYYPIQYNARLAYVNAADVKTVTPVFPPSTSTTSLQPGQTLNPGHSLTSSAMTLSMQTDGNLVGYLKTGGTGNGPAIWATGTSGHGGAYAYMQSDGNLVVYKSGGGPSTGGALWASNTSGHSGAYATLQTDGNFVVYTSSGGPSTGGALWATNVYDHSQTIASGQQLKPGWWTQAQYTRLVMQLDGNFVMYRNSDGKAIWAAGTSGHGGAYAYMQSDGNLVVYKSGGGPSTGGALWASNTSGHSGAYALMQNDGNLIVYKSGGGPTTGGSLWSTGTSTQVP